MRLQFRLLGPLLIGDDASTRPVPAAKQRIILASLLLRAGQIVSTRELIEYIWDDEPPAGARKLVQGYVMRLRHALGPEAGALLIPRSPGYLIELDEAEFDLRDLRDALAAGRAAASADDWQTAAVQLRRAVAQLRGQPLLDVPSAALHRNHVPHLIDLGLVAHEALADAEIHLGQRQAAATRLSELVPAHPNRESLHLRLMIVLSQLGRRAEALDAYRRFRRSLIEDLGIEPSPDVQALHRRLLQSGMGGTDAAHIERDPNRVDIRFTADPHAGHERFEPDPPRLPLTARGFSGRIAELRRLNDLIAVGRRDSKAVPIVVVSGMGGVGKTALALHWALQASNDFPDGQVYIDLRGHSEHDHVAPADALATILQSLGSKPEQVPADLIAATSMYRSRITGKRMLLLLDNARSSEQIRSLLPGDASCTVIVTSRRRLAELQVHDGAICMDLEALHPDEAEQLLDTLLGDQGRSEPNGIVEIAKLCAFLPLALRIAAARLAEQPNRSVIWLRDELAGSDRLSALQMDGDEDVAVRAAFDLSYRLMPTDMQRLFKLLGLMPGHDFSVEAVAALAGLTSAAARRGLRYLVAIHMLRAHDDLRYDFHDLIREFARSFAVDGTERPLAYARLYNWYSYCAGNAAVRLHTRASRLRPHFEDVASAAIGPDLADVSRAKNWLDQEFSQLAAAVRVGAQNGHADATIYLADALRGYLLRRASLGDWLMIADSALAAAREVGDFSAEAAAHLSAGAAYGTRDVYQLSVERLELAYTLAQQADWIIGEMVALANLAVVYCYTGDLAKSDQSYRRVIDIGARVGESGIAATARCNIGHILVDMGKPSEAIDWIAEALGDTRQLPSPTRTANVLDCYGLALGQDGQYNLARQSLTEALELSRQFGDDGLEAVTLAHLAAVVSGQGDDDHARTLASQAVELARIVGRPRIEALTLNVAAFLLVRDGDGTAAQRMASRAYDLASAIGCRGIEIEALINLARAHQLLGEVEPAIDLATRARDLADSSGYAGLARTATDILMTTTS